MNGEWHLLRTLPQTTVGHRVDAAPKLAVLALVSLAVSLHPTGPALGILVAVVAGAVLAVRPPAGAWPRLPRWFWVLTALSGVLSLWAGGAPDLALGPVTLGVGGLLTWLRIVTLTFGLAVGALVIGWTTPLADLAGGLRRLLVPLVALRIPVDVFVTTLGIAIRCVPLLADEVRTLLAARRSRSLPTPRRPAEVASDIVDSMIAGLVVAVRRGEQMASAMQARGGLGPTQPSVPRHRGADAFVVAVGVAAAAAILVV